MPFPLQQKRASSVMEVLLAVMILGVLAGLLLPVFQRKQANMDSIVCIQSLRTLYGAWRLYLVDHQETLPPYREFIPDGNNPPIRGLFWTARIRPYLDSPTFPQCPANPLKRNSYGMSTAISGGETWERMGGTQLPVQRFLLGESAGIQVRLNNADFADDAAFRHNGSAHLLFFDGHIEARLLQQIPLTSNGYATNSPTYKAFWRGQP